MVYMLGPTGDAVPDGGAPFSGPWVRGETLCIGEAIADCGWDGIGARFRDGLLPVLEPPVNMKGWEEFWALGFAN